MNKPIRTISDGKILHDIIIEKGIEVKEISEKFGVSLQTVYNYLKSKTLSNKIRKRFKETYNISIYTRSKDFNSDGELIMELKLVQKENEELRKALINIKRILCELDLT